MRTSSSLKFKKSFTLIELSIVLLILSLLVGSLLVGRQIVDRAKIQRIIFEFDYYEKAFHQFYDTYRVVPGNLDYKTCIKHAEFSGCACSNAHRNICGVYPEKSCDVKYDNQTWCAKHTVTRSISKKVVSCMGIPQYNSMIQLKKAGLINQDSMRYESGDWLTDTYACILQWNNVLLRDRMQYTNIHEARASFNPDVEIYFRGLGPTETIQSGYEVYRKSLLNHNAIFTFLDKSHNGWHSIDQNSATLSAKMTSELDAKIDDGRPGSGRLLALKAGYSLIKDDNETKKAVCYDQLVGDIQKSIYNASTNLKYGCNMMYIMEDVK